MASPLIRFASHPMPVMALIGEVDSQGWLVLAFVCTKRMTRAERTGQTRKAGCTAAAMFALILGFFGTFIQSVFAFVRAIRMADTQGICQARDVGGFITAMFTVGIHD